MNDMSEEPPALFPETIAPTVPLTKELENLYEFLLHQKLVHATNERELSELSKLSEKQLEAKARELENWNFRLNLDEAKEVQLSMSLGLLTQQQSSAPVMHRDL
ncbi:TPA: hypothetical protein N0F65_004371 [Lagenidium giganteum]|uniref:Uncharacterized protein n=1 Tax=Lagenidium giganteum TaxID=4803 RepID=A0AAV2ZG58_9STRA|nr:TPA: hypothetical protein N0F65_004371 [Lagenidium giganteum]